MLRRACCVSARASSKIFKSSRAVSRCWVETRLTSALSVRPRYAPMVTSCWAPVAKQYYATTTETRDLDTMGLEMKARGRKRLCCVKAKAPDVHSCGGLSAGVVWSMSDERRTHGRSEQRSLLLHCPWWPTSQSNLSSLKVCDLGFLPAISKILGAHRCGVRSSLLPCKFSSRSSWCLLIVLCFFF